MDTTRNRSAHAELNRIRATMEAALRGYGLSNVMIGLDMIEAELNARAPRMFGLDAGEVETMVRLAATTAMENQKRVTPFDPAEPFDAALMSFSDPDVVCSIARRTWEEIASE